jgi:hypothetical protein
MTPKEKAEELMLKYYSLIQMGTVSFAKQCALIAVDQVIEMLDVVCKSKSYDPFEAPTYDLKEWKQIKEEIEKL